MFFVIENIYGKNVKKLDNNKATIKARNWESKRLKKKIKELSSETNQAMMFRIGGRRYHQCLTYTPGGYIIQI